MFDFSHAVPSIVADTSALIALSAIHQLDLLREEFSEVLIPRAVYREIVTDGEGWFEAADAQVLMKSRSWIHIEDVAGSTLLDLLRASLGAGEAEAIALASERRLPVLVDDMEARQAAAGLKLEIVGALGIVGRGKRRGRIAAARPLVEALRAAGIYYSDSLITQFLTELHEI